MSGVSIVLDFICVVLFFFNTLLYYKKGKKGQTFLFAILTVAWLVITIMNILS